MHAQPPALLPAGRENTVTTGTASWCLVPHGPFLGRRQQHQGIAPEVSPALLVARGSPISQVGDTAAPSSVSARGEQRLAHGSRGKLLISSTQTHPNRPKIMVKSNCAHVARRSSWWGDAPGAFVLRTPAVRSPPQALVLPASRRGAKPRNFHQRMLSVGTSSCQPGEISHRRQLSCSTAS